MSNFRDLKIWKEGIEITKKVYELAGFLPDEEKYGLRSQICRCAVSIPSNIAEGAGRGSNADFKRFLEFALGSSYELETQLVVIDELKLVGDYSVSFIMNQLNGEQKMINSLISKLK